MADVGLFGGSFNPPHLGHLALARAARDGLSLTDVLWLPAGQPWQKDSRTLASGADRAAMVAALIAGERGMAVDARELQRSGPTYTIDTVTELMAERPGARLWLLLGQDQYARLHTWHQADALRERVQVAVAARDGVAPAGATAIPMPRMDLSATAIRAAVARGADVTPLVGAAVARYIAEHRLYRV